MSRRGGMFLKTRHNQKWQPHEKTSAARLDELFEAIGIDKSINEKQREAAETLAEARRAQRAAKTQDEKWPLMLERHRKERESATTKPGAAMPSPVISIEPAAASGEQRVTTNNRKAIMTTSLREAAQLALDALQRGDVIGNSIAVQHLSAALAQQDPAALFCPGCDMPQCRDAGRCVHPDAAPQPAPVAQPTDMHSSDCATHNAPAYPPGPCDCLPTQAMCRAAVVYINGADVYDKLPPIVLEVEEGIYGEVWRAMQAKDPNQQPAREPLTEAIQMLNAAPYALTKDECVQMLRELRTHKIGGAA